MEFFYVNWTSIKNFVDHRNMSIQWVVIENTYRLRAYDGNFGLDCSISLDGNNDQLDFEANYKDKGNKSPSALVTTQHELNDKVLKLARAKGNVDSNGKVELYFKVPGIFGSGDGRFLTGGYGISEDYNKDDYVFVTVEDKDRIIAWIVAQSQNSNATQPAPDSFIQGIGVIPGIGRAFPSYPTIASYTEEDAAEENKGWYFWPNAQGNNLPPVGEVEINPIGGYGFAPSGFYMKLVYQRPSGITTGSFRANFDWGKKE